MTPTYDSGHGGDNIEHKLDHILRLLHKINDKLNPDFSREDAKIRSMTQKVKDATGRIPAPVNPQQKGQ